eukprot:8927481-Alexandrium_andersonii.AAC.1
MSASLVGSEMCIRDRSSSPRFAMRECSSERTGLQVRSTPAPPQSIAGDSVSYTHLTLPTICSV